MAAIEGNWKGTVGARLGLNVRSGPGLQYGIINCMTNKTAVSATKEENGWYYIPSLGGWSSGQYIDNMSGGPIAVKKDDATTVTEEDAKESAKAAEAEAKKLIELVTNEETGKKEYKYNKENVSMEEAINDYVNFTEGDIKSTSEYVTKSLNGIYGIPYQFMSSVDQRIDGSSIGHVYADKIISRMPLLLISPGRVNFMRDYKSKSSAANALMKIVDAVNPVELDQMVNNVGRYYSFDFDYVNYYGKVNQMVASGAVFCGLQDTVVNVAGKNEKLGSVNWSNAGQQGFKSVLSEKEYVAFYIDSTNQISESFSNTTGESQLSSAVNGVSDIARELQFLVGNSGVVPEELMDKMSIENAMSKIDDISKKYLGGNKLLKDIANQFGTVAVGGKLLFPEIWQDSSFTKSYNISIKLRTPDGDKLSWFLNIYVPLCHLICLTAPTQSENGVSGYVSPPLIRAFYKGMFNCDMGIITDMNITKGKEGAWTIDGLPTEVDVDITLKDLYSALMVTKENNPGAFCNNLCLVDYIANTCGVNINEPDFVRQMDMYIILKMNKWKHVIPNVWDSIQQDLANGIITMTQKMQNLLFR